MLHGHDTGTTPTRVIDSRMNLKGKVAMWQQKADQHAEKQKYNFFSERNGCGVKRVRINYLCDPLWNRITV